MPLAREKRKAGEPISIALPERRWTEDFADDDWERSQYTWARGYHGVYVHRSRDDGRVYKQTVRLDCAPYRDGYTRTGVRLLAGGRLAYPLTEHHRPHNTFTYLFFSDDDGLSWGSPVAICRDDDHRFSEPDVVEISAGEMFCILRENIAGYLYSCRSTDGGMTWSVPEQTSLFGHPGQLFVLGDGRLLCTFGRRKAPFGIRVSISEDGGRSWQSELVVRDDLPNGDLGYPTTVEFAPGKLFCVYYGQDEEGVTYVMGTHLELD